MAKALKAVGTAIIIVGAIAATGGAALAFGAGATLGGALGLASSAVLSVGGFSVSAGALLTVGSLVSSVGGALSQPKVSTAGSALGWVGDPNGPMHFAAGRIAVAGDLRHKKAYGPNDRMYFSAVTIVSDAGPITAFESFTANDVPVTFDGSGKANSSYYANVMWRRTQLGNQPEASYLASPSGLEGGATLPNWGAGHKLSAKAAFILTFSENSKQSAYKGQYAKPRHVIRGLKAYDWRLDSTYPGGSGSHRLDQPATWTYTANPILWAVKWILGLWEGPDHGGAPQLDTQVGGMGVKVENIDLPAFTEAANVADTHGWTCAAWPSTDDDKAQVLDAFLQAGGAYYIQRGGKESCLHRAAPRVSVATISASDTAGALELDTGASFTQRKNCGVPTYLSEADGWKMTALGQVSSPQWVEEDGGRERSAPVTYSYVSSAKQSAELMCLAIAHTREGIRGRLPLKPYMQGIQPGSAFTITEPEFVLNGLKCLCLETSYDSMTGVHTVTFVSESDGKYDFAFGQAPNPPAPPALEAVDPTYVSPPLPGDWTITPRPPAPGGQLPGFDLGGIVSNDTATSIIVEHGPTGSGPWKQAYEGPPTVTNIPLDGLQPGATYYIAIQYRRDNNYSARHVYGPYVAPDLIATDVSPTAPTIVAMQDAIDLTEAGVGSLNTAVASLNATIYTAGTGLKARSDAMFASLNTPTTGVLARLTATESAVSTNNTAAVNRLNALEATVNTAGTGLTARLATAESAITANNNAATSRLTALEATVNTAGTGLSARVAGLQTAVSDLNSGKANASDLTALTARVTTAEGVNTAQNTRLNTVESDVAGKASATSVSSLEAAINTAGTGLLARTFAAESAIVDLQTGKADATRVTALEAQAGSNPNVLPNPSFANGFVGYDFEQGGAWSQGNDGTNGVYAISPAGPGTRVLRTSNASRLSCAPNTAYTFAADLNAGSMLSGDYTRLDIRWFDGSGVAIGYSTPTTILGNQPWTRRSHTAVSPSNAATWYARVYTASAEAASRIRARRLKFETGLVATLYSEELQQVGANARIGSLETTTANLTTQKADASRVTSLEATVNTPGTGVSARLTTVESVAAAANGTAKAIKGVVLDVNGYVSGYSSTNDGTTSAFEILAGVFGIRDPGSGERTEYRAGNWYVYSPTENTRTRYGKAFGGTQKLVWWTGPLSVAEGSETKANAYVYVSQNTVGGPRFGGSDVATGGSASALVVGPNTISAGGSAAIPANWSTIGSVSFAALPTDGVYEVTSTVFAPSGAAVSGAGLFTGQLQVVETKDGTTNVIYGPVAFTANQNGIAGGLVDVIYQPPTGLLTQTENGAVTLSTQIRRTSGSTTVSGLRTTMSAKWTKRG